ncbi:MAG: BrnT family toxin [Acidobacteriota bacterium]
MEFEWAPEKAARNLQKHRVAFGEATSVFGDPLSNTAPDPDHSHSESRYIIIGMSSRGRMLMVAYADRHGRIRLISARTLTRKEKRDYGEINK